MLDTINKIFKNVSMRQEIEEIIYDTIVQVKFTKRDGSERVMNCTLNKDVVPPATKKDPISQAKVRKVNEEVMVVWDVDKNAWRSFRPDSVIGYYQKELL